MLASVVFMVGAEGQMGEQSQGISAVGDALAEAAQRLRPVVPG